MSDEISPPSPTPEPAPGSGKSLSQREWEDVLAPMRQQVAASTALMLQESGEQLRKLADLSTAASGVAIQMMLTGNDPERAGVAMRQAREALTQATAHFLQLGRLSASLLSQFQPAASAPSAPVGRVEARQPEAQQAIGQLHPLADIAVRKP